jgi:hypothetical protein
MSSPRSATPERISPFVEQALPWSSQGLEPGESLCEPWEGFSEPRIQGIRLQRGLPSTTPDTVHLLYTEQMKLEELARPDLSGVKRLVVQSTVREGLTQPHLQRILTSGVEIEHLALILAGPWPAGLSLYGRLKGLCLRGHALAFDQLAVWLSQDWACALESLELPGSLQGGTLSALLRRLPCHTTLHRLRIPASLLSPTQDAQAMPPHLACLEVVGTANTAVVDLTWASERLDTVKLERVPPAALKGLRHMRPSRLHLIAPDNAHVDLRDYVDDLNPALLSLCLERVALSPAQAQRLEALERLQHLTAARQAWPAEVNLPAGLVSVNLTQSDDAPWPAALLSRLKRLQILRVATRGEGLSWPGLLASHPELISLQIQARSLDGEPHQLPSLRYLSLGGCEVDDKKLISIMQSFRDLHVLRVPHHKLTAKGLEAMIKFPGRRLRWLDLSHGVHIGDMSKSWSKVLASGALASAEILDLTGLNLSGGVDWSGPLPALRSLKLVSCQTAGQDLERLLTSHGSHLLELNLWQNALQWPVEGVRVEQFQKLISLWMSIKDKYNDELEEIERVISPPGEHHVYLFEV